MKAVAPALLYALFVWWFSTGVVLLLVLRRRVIVRASLIAAAALVPVCLYLLAKSSMQTGTLGAYLAFTAAIGLWATQEIGFLTGFLSGPRPLPCPPAARGIARVRYALGAILYHEVALLACGAAVAVVSWGGPNQVGTLTFFVLWIMRVSSKLNLFLGVPVLNDEIMPGEIAYLRSYFTRGPVNPFFPVAMLVAVLIMVGLVDAAADPDIGRASEVGYVLVGALMGLAILEHLFMLVPLPIEKLWRWSTRARRDGAASADSTQRLGGDIESVVPTRS